MPPAIGRGNSYTPNSARRSSRHRTPPTRAECEGAPTTAGRGRGQVGVIGKWCAGSKPSTRRQLPVHPTSLFFGLAFGSGRFWDVLEEGEEGEVAMVRTGRFSVALIANLYEICRACVQVYSHVMKYECVDGRCYTSVFVIYIF